MSASIRLNNFRFSIYIDADGTVTFTDLPPELHEVVAALDPSQPGGDTRTVAPRPCAISPAADRTLHQPAPETLG
jgi:hypothetical protein